MPFLLHESEIEAISKNEWRVESNRIRLRCRRWETTLRGNGSLSKEADGLHLRFYPNPGERFDPLREVVAMPPLGKIKDDSWYARGTFIDIEGRQWSVGRFSPSVSSGRGGFVISGRPDFVRAKRRPRHPTKSHYGVLYFFPGPRFPPNASTSSSTSVGGDRLRAALHRDAAVVEVQGIRVRLAPDVGVRCDVSSSTELPRTWHIRVCEALQFITASWHDWTIEGSAGPALETTCVRHTSEPTPSRIRPPLSSASPAVEAQAWGLFSAYLAFIWSKPEDRLEPLSGALRSIIRSATTAVEAEALQLCVSIENIVGKYFRERFDSLRVRPDELEPAIRAIKEARLGERLRDRILGLLGSMGPPRPIEIMKALADERLVRGELLPTYRKLRNPVAHGTTAGEELQPWVDANSRALALFYDLALAIIQYEGPYSDHSRPDLPTISYPPR